MRNFTIYLTGFLCLFLTKVFAQDTFEERAKLISAKIEAITKEEKEALKTDIEGVNAQLEKGSITAQQADEKKLQFAETHARNIENRVSEAENELKALVQEKVDGKLKEQDSTRKFTLHFDNKNKKFKNTGEHRTTSQVVFAFGLANLETNNAVAHSDFRVWGSHFFEVGISSNTRILKNHNLLHAKYGLSLVYNTLRPTENRFFDKSGRQTDLIVSSVDLKDSKLRIVNLVVPVYLEFDLSGTEMKDDKRIFRTHEGLRLGLGGFAGVNLNEKQILKFDDVDGNVVTQNTRGGYNVNDFVYGVGAYLGYKELCLYAKYELNPLFKNNALDQNSVSAGLRFDFN